MATYRVDSNAPGPTHDGSSWNDAYLTIGAAVTAASAGDVIWVHTATTPHSESITAADETWTGPTDATLGPITIIGVDKSDDSYNIASSANVTLTSTYDLNLNGAFTIYGLRIAVSGTGFIYIQSDYNEHFYGQDIYIDASSGTPVYFMTLSNGFFRYVGCTFDRGADDCYISLGSTTHEFVGCTFIGTHSSVYMFYASTLSVAELVGCDLSQLSTATLASSLYVYISYYGCRFNTAAVLGAANDDRRTELCFESDDDTGNSIARNEHHSNCGTSALVDTGNYLAATYDGTNEYSYVISVSDADIYYVPAYTPWLTGFLASTGSTTFTVNISNETANYDDTEVWLEVEYFGASGNTLKTIATDGETDPTVAIGSGTQQTTNSEAWTGLTSDFPQELSVTVTIGRAGSYRWRVGSRVATDIYIDPKIEIS